MSIKTGLLLDFGMLAVMGVGAFIYLSMQTPKLSQQPDTKALAATPTQSINASPTTTIANPASVYCAKVGGKLLIQTRGDNSQYGLCQFGDNRDCEEWALYRKACPIGGIKTTGYDTIQEKYCAWIGGKTIADPKATCTLPNNIVCKNNLLYTGKCPQSS